MTVRKKNLRGIPNAKYDANLIAKYFIEHCMDVTQKKLHKMMFFAYEWYLYMNNNSSDKIENRLFNNTFEAWIHGPVLRDIYPNYAKYGFRELALIDHFDDSMVESDVEFLEKVVNLYDKYSANELERLSHMDRSWVKARGSALEHQSSNTRIQDKDMYEELESYYGAK